MIVEEPTGRLQTALQAVIQASHYCEYMRLSAQYTVIGKDDGSPVTAADIGSQLIISHFIKSAFTSDRIVGEEDGQNVDSLGVVFEKYCQSHDINIRTDDYRKLLESAPKATTQQVCFWTVDPIDGTMGLLRTEHGQYAVCVAYLDHDGCPLLSVVGAPRLDKDGVLMYAIRGGGVYMCRLPSLESSMQDLSFTRLYARLYASISSNNNNNSNNTDNTMCVSHEESHSNQQLVHHVQSDTQLSVFKVESQVKYMLVAMGRAVAYLRAPRLGYREKIWDHAPGELLVTEAGGIVTDQCGNVIHYHDSGLVDTHVTCIVIAGSSNVHKRILNSISAFRE